MTCQKIKWSAVTCFACTFISFQHHTGITHEVRYSVFLLQVHSPHMRVYGYQLMPWCGSEWCTLKMNSCMLLFCSMALRNNCDITTLASSAGATSPQLLQYHWISLCVLECTNNAVKLAHILITVICSLSLKDKIQDLKIPTEKQAITITNLL